MRACWVLVCYGLVCANASCLLRFGMCVGGWSLVECSIHFSVFAEA